MASKVGNRPGEWVSAQARRRERQVWLLLAVVVVVVAVVVFLSISARATGLVALALGLLWILNRVGKTRIDEADRWMRGAHSEVAVGNTLTTLEQDGYTVLHDLPHPYEGNVDHLVSGPNGVYLIETKHRAYLDSDLPKARRQAKRIGNSLGVWVTPVICCDRRRPQTPHSHDRVWIVSHEDLIEWLTSQRNKPGRPERLAALVEHRA